MASYSDGVRKEQESQFAGSLLGADPLGNIIYVDSVNGKNGNNGNSPRAALKTLTQAVAKASAGDTIIVDKGGGETVTAAISVSMARLKIICKTDNNRSGFTVTGAGTLDLISVTGTDCHIEGIQFAHTGATANASGILASAAAHRLTVRKCLFDDTAIVTTLTGVGVEITAGADDSIVEGCLFLDVKYGVQIVASGTNITNRPLVKDCEFFIGGAAFFGVYAAAGTGSVQGIRIDSCKFHEANGDGTVSVNTWDGTNGTNGTQGPISFGAAIDQYRVYDCVAYTAAAVAFDLLNAINAGATGDMIGNSSGEGGDIEDKVDLINPNTNTKCTSSEVVINANTAAKCTSSEVVIDAATVAACTSSEVVINANTTAKCTSSEVVIAANTNRAGRPVGLHVVIEDSTVPNNAQTKAIATATTGAVWIEEIIIAKDATAFNGPTNIEITCDNTYGPTGVTNLMANVKAGLAANLSLRATQGGVTPFVPMVLEAGKKLYIEGSDAAGNSAGNLRITVKGCAMADGAYLA